MNLLLWIFCLCWLPIAQEEPHRAEAQAAAFIELAADKNAYYVQEPIRIRVRFGLESRFLEQRLIPLVQQRLDLPVQVLADWIDGPDSTLLQAVPAGDRRGWTSFVLNNARSEARPLPDRVQGERRFKMFEIERCYLPTRPGELTLPGPVLRLAYTSRFEESLVTGSMPIDRHEIQATGRGITLQVTALPEEGRPADFSGAVGSFSVRVTATPRELTAGDSLKLRLHIEGTGNLSLFTAPDLSELDGFHCYGLLEEKGLRSRILTYDLAPLDSTVKEVPMLTFSFFEPGPSVGYCTLETEPIPIRVSALPENGALPPLPGSDEEESANHLTIISLVGLFFLVLIGVVVMRSRKRRLARGESLATRVHEAAIAFQTREAGKDLGKAYTIFLAACLGCAPGAVIDPNLRSQLVSAGIPGEDANRAADLLEKLVEARYGGAAPAGSAEAAAELVNRLVGDLDHNDSF